MNSFTLNVKQTQAINKWLTENVYPVVIEAQKKIPELKEIAAAKEAWKAGYPYEGTIGGGLTYTFSPTSLGVVQKVYYITPEFTLDVTDYDDW